MNKNNELAKIHIAKTHLGMDDESYRLMLENLTGKRSCKAMNAKERQKVLTHLIRNLGWKPRSKRGYTQSQPWRKPRIAKIVALWFVLYDAGIVRDKRYSAMEHWCQTITGKASLNWADPEDLNRCIEGLKAWCQREGVKTCLKPM